MAVGSVWMPIYPGATIEGTASTKQDDVTESTLNFETKDPADRVLSFYQAALKKGVVPIRDRHEEAGGGTVQSMVHDGKDDRGGDDPRDGRPFPGRNPDHRSRYGR